MIKVGVSMEVISKRLGHAPIDITMDRYGHLMEAVGEPIAKEN